MWKKWVPLWTIPVLVAFATGTVWLRLSIIKTTYEINQTERAIEQGRLEREKLELKVAALRSPRRLEGLARTRFGFMQPRAEQIVHFKKSELEGNAP